MVVEGSVRWLIKIFGHKVDCRYTRTFVFLRHGFSLDMTSPTVHSRVHCFTSLSFFLTLMLSTKKLRLSFAREI